MSRLDAKLKNIAPAKRHALIESFISKHVIMNATHMFLDVAENDYDAFPELFSVVDKNDDFEDQYREPLQFFFVSNWLADALQDKGALIAEYYGSKVWGRETIGQAIVMDSVIEAVFCDHIKDSWWGFDLLGSKDELVKKVKALAWSDVVEFLLHIKENNNDIFQDMKEMWNPASVVEKTTIDLIYSNISVYDLKTILNR